jgi:transposase
MGLQQDVEKRMGESVGEILTRNAMAGKSVRHCSILMDVSYSTSWRWANRYGVKFNTNNPFRSWRLK